MTNLIWAENLIHELVREAIEKRESCVSILVSGNGDININVMPWPDEEIDYD